MPREQPQLKLKSQDLFEKYLANYISIPNHKKILSSMIKFEKMYRPIIKPWGYADITGRIEDINERRSYKKAKLLLSKRDLVQTFDGAKGKRLVVTSRGHRVFYKDYPLAKLRDRPWDGHWTVVMYDFPERQRTARRAFRRKLMGFGFGSPQISILVSPLPIEGPIQELLEGEDVADKVWTLKAKRVLGMENRDVVQKSWPVLDELNALYRELLDVLPAVKKDHRLKDPWCMYFLAVNSADPYLPLELFPRDWYGKRCEDEFVKLGRFGFMRSVLSRLSQG